MHKDLTHVCVAEPGMGQAPVEEAPIEGPQTIQLPDGVPASYEGCATIAEYPSTPFNLPPFQELYRQSPVKQRTGETCSDGVCMDVYELDEIYVPDYELLPRNICRDGTKMLLYDGMFPGPTLTQTFGRQVRTRQLLESPTEHCLED